MQFDNKYTITQCEQCGADIMQILSRKNRCFCSDKCRTKWWYAHKGLMNRKTAHEYNCHYCGKTFSAYPKDNRKYCSHNCYITNRFGSREERAMKRIEMK